MLTEGLEPSHCELTVAAFSNMKAVKADLCHKGRKGQQTLGAQ